MTMSHIKPSTISKLDAISFDALLREQGILVSPAPRFDLRSVRFITLAELVQLAATCYALHREGRAATTMLAH